MMSGAQGPYAFVTLDVFTDQRFGGNPLAVFPDATGLDGTQMQSLAAEFNLSETTFVFPPQNADNTAQVRIFTPQVEIGFAGHPNLGTAWVLAQQGKDKAGLLRFEEAGGLVTVSVERQAGSLVSCQVEAPHALTMSDAPAPADLAACGGLKASDLLQTDVASVGLDCVYALVPEAALAHAAPDLAAFRALAQRWLGPQGRFHLCLYARDGQRLHARVFGPLNGVTEDPACGSATSALAAMLLHRDGGDSIRLLMHMGAEMGRPSVLHCGARREADGIRAWVGGGCVNVLRGEALV